MNCRHCKAELEHVFVDLGFAPPSNAYLTAADLNSPEVYFPLRVLVCEQCWLVQTQDHSTASELFRHDYAYFSSVSQDWLNHAATYARMIISRLGLDKDSFVLEVAANDGYLLRNFIGYEIPCLGIEPTASTAAAAEQLGVPILREFFTMKLGEQFAREGKQADLIVCNNVCAHVPDINDFAQGLKRALKHRGTITLEFPHLMRLIEDAQFDTIYHEHFSYFSLGSLRRIFSGVGLRFWDVEALSTHGGSLRVYCCHTEDSRSDTAAVEHTLAEERRHGLFDLSTYSEFQRRADKVKNDLVAFLIAQKRAGKTIAGYGAAAKGNTIMNYAGIKPDLLPYVCDAAPSKQGKFLPGTHIPVLSPSVLRELKPDMILVLPWNIANEVIRQHGYVREWGGEFFVAVPTLRILP